MPRENFRVFKWKTTRNFPSRDFVDRKICSGYISACLRSLNDLSCLWIGEAAIFGDFMKLFKTGLGNEVQSRQNFANEDKTC